jgi:hypothetical protein
VRAREYVRAWVRIRVRIKVKVRARLRVMVRPGQDQIRMKAH